MVNEVIQAGRILFIDDEKNIRKSIKRELFSTEYDFFVACSAKEGLEILANEPIDIVVSDIRMPVMNGFELLEIVKTKYPDTDRIILSGFVDEATVMQAIVQGLATTYLTKPWETENLLGTLDHILQLRKQLHSDDIMTIVSNIEKLPTLPGIYQNLMQAIGEQKSFTKITEIIEQDVSIATKVLQVANSAYYGFKKTTSLTRAVAILGLSTLRDIVLTNSLIDQLEWTEEQKTELEEIAKHSLIVNRMITEYYKDTYAKILPMEFKSVGITHDIGKIILLQYFYEDYKKIKDIQEQDQPYDFHECEIKAGFNNRTHAEIGSFFLNKWNLPHVNCDITMNHHKKSFDNNCYCKLLQAVDFTNNYVNFIRQNYKDRKIDVSKFESYGFSNDKLCNYRDLIRSQYDEGNGI
ncbi:MAG: HDOD domain-containing protein [Candidatus Zixiibacteriota bacterium]